MLHDAKGFKIIQISQELLQEFHSPRHKLQIREVSCGELRILRKLHDQQRRWKNRFKKCVIERQLNMGKET